MERLGKRYAIQVRIAVGYLIPTTIAQLVQGRFLLVLETNAVGRVLAIGLPALAKALFLLAMQVVDLVIQITAQITTRIVWFGTARLKFSGRDQGEGPSNKRRYDPLLFHWTYLTGTPY
ncbi:MAG TPA: hypothetical protein VFT65_10370 [Candidatus Angelobacter sp.]|nr:hypothetical protein [Candidatus Angelobacter sp.]